MPSQPLSGLCEPECPPPPPLHHRQFFDRAAVTWDDEVRVDPRRLEEILRYACIRPGDSVLDVGCGTGVLLPRLLVLTAPPFPTGTTGCQEGGQVYALDISSEMLARARRKYGEDPRLRFLLASAEDIPLADASCQVVICFSAFPHFLDKAKAVEEMARVLTPGGRLLIAHAEGRGRINALHRRIGGAVAGDSLPDAAAMASLLDAGGLKKDAFVDRDDIYVLLATKPAQMQ